uniref:CSON007228 protein n=1 Tax=Culicoides sonorensis TaxID=179676 RepID=A0A336M1E4_CULSO
MSQNDVGSVPFSWLPAYGEAVEQALSASRNMLETILEETSDDEDSSEIWNNSGEWDSSNSDSVSNSVIEVEVNQETETLSERDFICPAKRRRQDCDIIADTNFVFKRPLSDGDKYRVVDANSLLESEDFLPKRNELRYRFDEIGLTPDLYSDTDSLSYNSLSRSSSLIQFESLERQLLQNDGAQQQSQQQQQQSFSGSTPILSSESSNSISNATQSKVSSALSDFERMLCRKNTNNLLQTAKCVGDHQVLNINRGDDDDEVEGDVNSDTSENSYSSGVDESSTNSSFSSEESYYLNHSSDKNSDEENEEEIIVKNGNKTQGCVNGTTHNNVNSNNVIAFNRRFSNSSCSGTRNLNTNSCVSKIIVNGNGNNVRNKNSVESLSEDSGFCDQSITNSLKRVKSKSNPSLNVSDNHGQFSANQPLIGSSSHLIDDDICYKSMEDLSSNMETRNKNIYNNNRGMKTTTKLSNYVESRRRTDSKNNNNSQNSISERRQTTTAQRKIVVNNNKSEKEKISRKNRVKSSSSPELRSPLSIKTKKNQNNCQINENSQQNSDTSDLFQVSSVPNDLNLCGEPGSITSNSYNSSYNKISSDSIANHNVNLFHLNSPLSSTPSVLPINPSLTASYANLTLLNYSDDHPNLMASNGHFSGGSSHTGSSDLLTNRKYSSSGVESPRSEFSSLLEEITAHFDRNLSILNDQQDTYEPSVRTIYEEPESTLTQHPIPVARPKKQPPLPPPRKSSKNKIISPTFTSITTQALQSIHSDSLQSKNINTHHDEIDYAPHHHQHPPPSYTEYLLSAKNSNGAISKTFDQDPTNLRTTYTESLEQCNFDSNQCSSVDLDAIRANMVSPSLGIKGKDLSRQSQIHGRVLVQSTPNLNTNRSQFKTYDMNDSLEHHNSLKDVTMITFMGTSKQGILHQTTSVGSATETAQNTGSKSGLSKGVSFCPIVSEISWQDTNVSDDSLSGASSNSSNNVSAYPKYNMQDEDDLDDDELIALENYRTNQNYDEDDEEDENDSAFHQGTKSWINEDEMNGKNNHCGDFGEYLLPIYSGSGAENLKNTFTTTFVIDNLDKQQNNKTTKQEEQKQQQHGAIRHTSVVHIPIVNNNSHDRIELFTSERDNHTINNNENNCISSGNINEITSIHKDNDDSVKMYANEKRSQNNNNNSGGAIALNSDTIGATSANVITEKSVISHSVNKNIKNNNQMMNNQKINKASYLDAVSSVNNNNGHNGDQKVQVSNLMTNNKNNNIEKNLNLNKFEVQKSKKKDGFLSRISSGLRFSFRGKKGQKAQTGSNAVYNYNQFDGNQPIVGDYAKKQNMKVTRQNNQDIVFIPLKDPTTENVQSFIEHEIENAHLASSADNSHNNNNNHMLHGKKPPIPSKPPRPFVTGRPPIHPKSVHAQQRGTSLSPPRDTANNVYHEIVPANQLRAATLSGKYLSSGGDCANDHNATMGSEQKIGLIETNLDTHETIITGKTQSLMELGGPQNYSVSSRKGHTIGPVSRAIINSKANKTIIGNHHHNNTLEIDDTDASNARPHKSMEFLLDKENHQQVLPPENELQKSHETNTNLSEHQLRVQASLQRLNVPDWYKTYTSSTTGTGGTSTPAGNRSTLDSSGFLRKRNSDVGRWTGLNSKTTSLSSLGSQRSDRSPVMLSPSSHSHHGQTGFSRWSTSHLNSNQTSPSVSTRGSFTRGVLPAGYQSSGNNTLRGSYRQPYLGWRSQEKLAQQQNSTTGLRTPAERLASSLLQQKQQQQQQHQRDADSKPPIPPHHQPQYQQHSSSLVGTPEIKDEIKEVTSAIVHYVNDQQNRNSRSRSTSPSQRCWLESSFVGTKPLESPQTPVIDNTNVAAAFHASSSASLPRHVSPSLRINDGSVNGTGESTYETFSVHLEILLLFKLENKSLFSFILKLL